MVNVLQDIIPAAMIGDQLNTESPVVINTNSLDLGGHGITNLFGIQFFTSLEKLECQNNGLLVLPNLPPSLKELYCNSNQLSSLPELPSNLTHLDCSSNDLNLLPKLPTSLKSLTCFRNKLTSLPELPKGLTELICYNNKILCLPVLPNSLKAMDISKNQITCIPNHISLMDTDSLPYPICETGNKNGCIPNGQKKK